MSNILLSLGVLLLGVIGLIAGTFLLFSVSLMLFELWDWLTRHFEIVTKIIKIFIMVPVITALVTLAVVGAGLSMLEWLLKLFS